MPYRRPLAVVLAAAVVGFSAWSGSLGAQDERGAAPPSVAAEAFLATLDDAELKTAVLDPADASRMDWHFIPKPTRKGLMLKEMDRSQQLAARKLLASLVSAAGYKRAEQVMTLESVVALLENDPVKRDPLKYYFTLFGRPNDAGEPWAASIEGHHLSLNFLVKGDEVIASTPLFFGANPATVPDSLKAGAVEGVEAGDRILSDPEDAGFDLLNSLTDAQRAVAHIDQQPPREIRSAGKGSWTVPPMGPEDGLRGVKMTPPQREKLKSIVEWHLAPLPDAERGEKLAAMKDAGGLRALRFAWLGATEPGIGHGYRVRGPSLLIEFVNSQPDSFGNPANHAHAVVHDPAGDFGDE
ncbi:DUF3500 domain-containing protein [Alienimonas chondri]|uniref:DUF3500 domain-containing protein n=1 Tax=Alienimonas chondri TaxID=2681879 RepID=A0ABX1VBU8_9PLAN|nr:DUF3500 domain-containing protein [Alienimonas chondri]NNJ25558.1 hypothetical protein [Alienimonas chondri]